MFGKKMRDHMWAQFERLLFWRVEEGPLFRWSSEQLGDENGGRHDGKRGPGSDGRILQQIDEVAQYRRAQLNDETRETQQQDGSEPVEDASAERTAGLSRTLNDYGIRPAT